MSYSQSVLAALTARGRRPNRASASAARGAPALMVGVEVVAGLALCAELTRWPVADVELLRAGLLAVFAVGCFEVLARLGSARRFTGCDRPGVGQATAWTCAGAVTLPPGWAGLFVVAVHGYLFIRFVDARPVRAHWAAYCTAAGLMAAIAAATVGRHIGAVTTPAPGLMAAVGSLTAAGAFLLIGNGILLAGAAATLCPDRLADLLPDPQMLAGDASAVLAALVTAEFLTHAPWLMPLIVVVLAVGQRSTLVTPLRRVAATDPKTGLLNLPAWRDRAGQMLSAAGRSGDSVSVAVIDLDGFKRMNDVYGHLAGDDVLLAVATCLRHEMRAHDVVARFGGDEFVVALSGIDLAGARSVAQRWRRRVAQVGSTDGPTVSLSIGVAFAPQASGIALDELLQAADLALYAAKAAGRNRVHSTVLSANQPTSDHR